MTTRILLLACFTFLLSFQTETWAEETPDLLKGGINDTNEQYRGEHYVKKLHEAYKKNKDPTEALVADGDLLISQMLGTDFSKEKQLRLNIIQRKMFLKRKTLEELYNSHDLSLDAYEYQIEKVSTDSFVSAAKVLSDDEFEKLFGFQKSEISKAFDKIIEPLPKQ